MLQTISRSRWLRLLTLAFFLQLVAPFSLPGQTRGVVKNVRLEVLPERAYVLYDLAGSAGDHFSVVLTLHREGAPEFRYVPENVTGDVGPDVQGGGARRIIWEYSREYPQGLAGDDYYVVVEAVPVSSGGINPVILATVGTAILAGVIVLVVGGGGDDGGGGTSGFPRPAGRP